MPNVSSYFRSLRSKRRSHSVLAYAASAGSALGVAVALLAGCGGGGGGSSGGASPTPLPSGELFLDDFNASSLNKSNWGVYSTDQVLQRTNFGNEPKLMNDGTTSFARMQLDSYNPNHLGQFKGTEIFTKTRYPVGNGLQVDARLRAPGLPPGIIFAFFMIYDRYNGIPSDATYLKDEIDFEFLTAEKEQFSPQGQSRRLYLNIWNDWNISDGYDGDDIPTTTSTKTDKTYQIASDPNFSWENWNTYTIRWFPDRTEYLLNGVVNRVEHEVKPDDAMSVHFNMWTGTPDFNQAYSSSLVPTTDPNQKKSYVFDVDYIKVSQITADTAARTATAVAQPLSAGLKSYRNR